MDDNRIREDMSENGDEYRRAPGADGVIMPYHRRHSEYHANAASFPAADSTRLHKIRLRGAIYPSQYWPQPVPNVRFHGIRSQNAGLPTLSNRDFQQPTYVPPTGPQEIWGSLPTHPDFINALYPTSNNPYVGVRLANNATPARNWSSAASNRDHDDHLFGPWNWCTSVSQLGLDPWYHAPGGSAPLLSDHFHCEPAPISDAVGASSLSDPVTEQQPKTYPCRLAKYSNQSGRRGTTTVQGANRCTSPFVSCGRRFTQPDHFITHVKKDHEIPNSKRSTEDVECAWEDCNRTITMGSYHRHIVEVHGGIARHRSNEQK